MRFASTGRYSEDACKRQPALDGRSALWSSKVCPGTPVPPWPSPAQDGVTAVTEDGWLISTDPWSMLQIVKRSMPSERKLRLFNATICRRFWNYLPEASRAILSESELLADGLTQATLDERDLCRQANSAVAPFDRQYPTKQFPSREVRIQRDAAAAVCYAVLPGELWAAASYFWDIDTAEKGPHTDILRDIFGNPFRPAFIDLTWLTPSVTSLAAAAYEERSLPSGELNPARLGILADALEEAGCTDMRILDHLRSVRGHVRGCWAVDLLLGKK